MKIGNLKIEKINNNSINKSSLEGGKILDTKQLLNDEERVIYL